MDIKSTNRSTTAAVSTCSTAVTTITVAYGAGYGMELSVVSPVRTDTGHGGGGGCLLSILLADGFG